MATIVDQKKRIPFRRGMLELFLIQRNFSHEEAHDTANVVREALSKIDEIPKDDFIELVGQIIRQRHGERPLGDLAFWDPLPSDIIVEGTGGARVLAKEILARSLQTSGLAADQAHQLARGIEINLIETRTQRIDQSELEKRAASMLANQYDETYAERYLVWRRWSKTDRPLFILIGGASGVGKTSLAVSLANVLDIPRLVATDDIRQIMRQMLSAELLPIIHQSSYTAWTELPPGHIEGGNSVIAGYREQVDKINVGVQAILQRCAEENTSVIIDGVHLLPDFIDAASYGDSAYLVNLCLAVSERQVYEERFAGRAFQAPARGSHKYLANLDHILEIQDHILERCAQSNVPVIDMATLEDATQEAVMVVGQYLRKQEGVKSKRTKKRASTGKRNRPKK